MLSIFLSYIYNKQNPDDLRLYSSEVIEVIEKNDHGWWLGIAARDGTIHKGYFPKNYVKPYSPNESNIPKPPPRPLTLPKANVVVDDSSSSNNIDTNVTSTNNNNNNEINLKMDEINIIDGPSFSLKSLDAFDELVNVGYTIELNNTIIIPKFNGIKIGTKVTIKCIAMTWDGASTKTKEFANSTVTFIVGSKTVTSGLDIALQHLNVGQHAIITCSPSWAYGAAGNPPSVPPNSYVVFNVEVIQIENNDGSSSSVGGDEGAQLLLGSGIGVRNKKTTTTTSGGGAGKRGSRIILVNNLNDPEATTATA